MMKRFLVFGVFVLGLLLLTSPSQAAFEDDYQGYLQTYDAYRTAHTNYISTRNQYYQYGTLTSKNEALAAAKEIISQRDKVLLAHMSLLRLRNTNEAYRLILDDHYAYLESHNNAVPQIGDPEALNEFAEAAEERIGSVQIVSRQVVWNLVLAKIDHLKLRYIVMESDASGLANALRAANKDVSTLDRWLIEAQGKRSLAETKLDQARVMIASMGQVRGGTTNADTQIKVTLFEANQYLKEGIAYLKEFSEAIKYGNY